MDLLIDTNIILDLVLGRENYQTAISFFKTIERVGANAYITATTVTDLFYIIRKNTHDTQQTYAIMENIFKLVSVTSVTDKNIQSIYLKTSFAPVMENGREQEPEQEKELLKPICKKGK